MMMLVRAVDMQKVTIVFSRSGSSLIFSFNAPIFYQAGESCPGRSKFRFSFPCNRNGSLIVFRDVVHNRPLPFHILNSILLFVNILNGGATKEMPPAIHRPLFAPSHFHTATRRYFSCRALPWSARSPCICRYGHSSGCRCTSVCKWESP